MLTLNNDLPSERTFHSWGARAARTNRAARDALGGWRRGRPRVRPRTPSAGPPITPDPSLREVLDTALVALGRLDSVAALLPDTQLFLYSYVRKEAVLSSQIEGTQSSLS